MHLKTEKEVPFCNETEITEADVFKMSVKEWKTSGLKAQLIKMESDKDLRVCGDIEDNMLILHFVMKGDVSLSYNTNCFFRMTENTNNVFAVHNNSVSHCFNESGQYEYFKVFLPFDFIYSDSKRSPEVFEPVINLLESHCPFMLYDQKFLTTPDMQSVIEQIKGCQIMGDIAPLYFENKVQELLLLQLLQKRVHKCSRCSCYRHYNKQVNEARNMIEDRYKNPPTIKELAATVGMSTTVLKASFKLFFGATIYGYLFNYRMNIAQRLLLETPLTITEIAIRSGYEHASHFTTAFKRKFGVSPLDYRKSVYSQPAPIVAS